MNNKQKGIIVIGAGGHAKVCIEILESIGEQVDYCIGQEDNQDFCLQVPVLKGDDHLKQFYKKGYRKAFIAIGDNKIRKKMGLWAIEQNYEIINAISPYAIISPSASLGKGVVIVGGAIINAQTKIDDFVIINTGATIDHDCIIGEASHIAPQSILAGNVKVGRNSFLGIGTKVIPEKIIGDDVMVGAGAVVIKNIKNGDKVIGVPAISIYKDTRGIIE